MNNFKKRKETNEPVQYTITILPGFLIPYGRVPIDKILDAFSGYTNGDLKTYYAAALVCGCNSRHSFRLYYIRILANLLLWSRLLRIAVSETTSIPDQSNEECDEIEEKWDAIVTELKSLARETATPQWQARGHVHFFFNNMGLGP